MPTFSFPSYKLIKMNECPTNINKKKKGEEKIKEKVGENIKKKWEREKKTKWVEDK